MAQEEGEEEGEEKLKKKKKKKLSCGFLLVCHGFFA